MIASYAFTFSSIPRLSGGSGVNLPGSLLSKLETSGFELNIFCVLTAFVEFQDYVRNYPQSLLTHIISEKLIHDGFDEKYAVTYRALAPYYGYPDNARYEEKLWRGRYSYSISCIDSAFNEFADYPATTIQTKMLHILLNKQITDGYNTSYTYAVESLNEFI